MSLIHDLVTEKFDNWAADYEASMKKALYFAPDWIRRHVYDLDGVDQCRVLDLGCGTGLNVKTLNRLRGGIRAVGVDASPKMLEHASATKLYDTLQNHDLNFPLPHIPSDAFDLVVAFGFLEMLSDVGVCLSECKRALKRGGTLWASFRLFEEISGEWSPPERMNIDGIPVAGHTRAQILYSMNHLNLAITTLDTVVGYTTQAGFPCPFYVLSAQKPQ